MLVHQAVLEYNTPNVTTGDVVANLEASGLVLPLLLTVQRIDGNTTGDVDTVGLFGDGLEGSLNTIVNCLHQTGTELDGQGLTRPSDGITNSQASCRSGSNQSAMPLRGFVNRGYTWPG